MPRSKRIELVPGLLRADITMHDVTALGNPQIACWTVVTAGLASLGRQEIALTLVRDSDSLESFPESVLDALCAVWTSDTLKPGIGRGAILGLPPQPLRLLPFAGLLFVPATPIEGVDVPRDALAGIFVTEDELAMASISTPYRILSRLGQIYSYFPWPYWSDPSRPVAYTKADLKSTLLSRVGPVLEVPGCHAALCGDQLRLYVPQSAAEPLAEALAAKGGLTIVLDRDPDPRVNGALVWSPEHKGPFGITSGNPTRPRIAVWFLVVTGTESSDNQLKVYEDGYAALLTRTAFEGLLEALRTGRDWTTWGGPRNQEMLVTTKEY